MKNILWLAGIGVGGYLAYQWWQNQQAATAAASTALPAGTTPVMGQQISVITPAGGEPTATQLENQTNRLTATAADWNAAYTILTGGRGIDTLYGFDFSSVYSGIGAQMITAQTFLTMAKATGLSPHISLSGFGRSYGPVYRIPVSRMALLWR
jgi:hypothetical protein